MNDDRRPVTASPVPRRSPAPKGAGVTIEEFGCGKCGSYVATLAIVPPNTTTWASALDFAREHGEGAAPDTRPPTDGLVIETWSIWSDGMSTGFHSLEPTEVEKLRSALVARDSRALYQRGGLGNRMSAYCGFCNDWYCTNHWKLTPVMEDDTGWYDYTIGTCPFWHERIVHD